MGGEVINTQRPGISFATDKVAPPSPLYITKDDNLNIAVWSSVAGTVVEMRARLLLPDGSIVSIQEDFRPTSDRAQNSFARSLTEGFLLSVSFANVGTIARRGQLYVQMWVAQGDPSLFQFSEGLISGYLATGNMLVWPYGTQSYMVEGAGMLRSVTGTNPAAGVEITETVPTNARWKLLAITFSLVTAVAVATRTVRLVLDDGVNIYAQFAASADQVASLTRQYNAVRGGGGVSGTAGDIDIRVSTTLPLFQGHRIRTLTAGLQAADDFGAPQFLVEEWLED
ncbi:MAG: hypothetical protein ACRD2K_03835 [Terriglobales bacterium]